MSKRNIILALLLLFIAFLPRLYGQDFSDLDKSPMDAVMARSADNSSLVRIIYSRPFKRNRQIFGKLLPYGELWRTGANEATEIRFYEHCLVHGKPIKKGTYALFSIPGKKEWTIIFNTDYKSWGAYNYNDQHDVLRFTLPALETATVVEQFSISARPAENGTTILLGWDNTYLQFEVTADPDLYQDEIKEFIEESETAEEATTSHKKTKKRKKFLWIF